MKIINIIWLLLLIPSVIAVTELNNTIIQATGINTNLSINQSIWVDSIEWGSNFIYLENYQSSLSGERITANINLTASNTLYIYNSTRKDIPGITYSTANYKDITTKLPINITLYITTPDCNVNTIYQESTATAINPISCTDGLTTFNSELVAGTNNFTVYYFAFSQGQSNNIVYAGAEAYSHVIRNTVIAIFAIMAILVIGILLASSNGAEINIQSQGQNIISYGVLIAIALIVAIFTMIFIAKIANIL